VDPTVFEPRLKSLNLAVGLILVYASLAKADKIIFVFNNFDLKYSIKIQKKYICKQLFFCWLLWQIFYFFHLIFQK